MGTEIALPMDIPAHIKALAEKAAIDNKSALGGIKAGGFPRISIGGSKFSIVESGEKVLLTDPNNPDLPVMQLEVAVIGYNPNISKKYYEGEFEDGNDKEPNCSSDDGIRPDPHIAQPQSQACANCPMNVWGSKISKQGKQIKACSDSKRLAVLLAPDFENESALDLTITPASLKEWANYVRALDSKGVPVDSVVTKVQFDPQATFPKLIFKFGRFLTPEELAVIAKRAKGDDVRLIIMPRTSTATGPVQQATQNVVPPPPAPAPKPAAPAAPQAPAPAPKPTAVTPPAPPPPAAADPFAGLPPHVRAAVDAVGGVTSEPGKAVYKSLTGKDVPAAAPAPAPKPVDPFEGQPAHVKPAVDAVGGIGSPAGAQVYKALTGKDVPAAGGAAAAAPAAPSKPRNRRSAPVPTPTPAPAAVTPPPAAPAAAAPAAPAASFVAPATGAGLGADLDALLASAMGTPAGQ